MSPTMDPKALLDQLDPDQQAVARQVTGPLLVKAGAGTGKTRAITYRIAYAVATGAYDVHSVLAVTFTARAAMEMASRLAGLGVPGVQARTFHSAALRQLTYFWGTAIGGTARQINPSKMNLLPGALAQVGVGADRELLRDIATEIEWMKVSLLTPAQYLETAEAAKRVIPGNLTSSDFARIAVAYEELKEERGVIDFEDVILLMIGILETRPDIAAAIQRQYQHFVVDEYQDVSPLQQRLLDLWLGKRTNLCVVGDPSQTIYSFTGATSSYLTGFKKRFPQANIVELQRNYRSTEPIVDLANRVAASISSHGPQQPRSEGRADSPVILQSQSGPGPEVEFLTYGDDGDEARATAARIEQLHQEGVKMGDIAILYRTNFQASELETALAQCAIPFQVHGGQQFFSRLEVRQAMTLLRTRLGQDPTAGAEESCADVLSSLGYTTQAPEGRGAVRERWEALNALNDLAATAPSLRHLVADLEERAQAKVAPDRDAVTLSTLHAAKGLEWGTVFLIGAAEGILPINQAKGDPEAVAEECRLTYVGVTRAQERLIISWARARSDRRPSRTRSRFFDRIWPGSGPARTAKPLPATASKTMSARAQTREFLESATPLQRQLFEQLRAWRGQLAELSGRIHFQIMPDVTLRDIATMRPQTVAEVARMRGIGQVKLDQYATAIIDIVAGGDPEAVAHATWDRLQHFDAADISS